MFHSRQPGLLTAEMFFSPLDKTGPASGQSADPLPGQHWSWLHATKSCVSFWSHHWPNSWAMASQLYTENSINESNGRCLFHCLSLHFSLFHWKQKEKQGLEGRSMRQCGRHGVWWVHRLRQPGFFPLNHSGNLGTICILFEPPLRGSNGWHKWRIGQLACHMVKAILLPPNNNEITTL